MKKFNIPGYFIYHQEIRILLRFIKEHPEYFYKDRIIERSYDLPGGLIWNGGRVKYNYGYYPEELNNTMMYYFNETDLQLCHTCTNGLINNELVYDRACNYFLELYMRDCDFIIINSHHLFDYLLSKYPLNQFIISTTLDIKDLETVNKISKTNLLVLNYNYNNDDGYLKQLENPNNIEIICAEPCQPNCPNRANHYNVISKEQLYEIDFDKNKPECPFDAEGRTFYEIQQLPHAINNKRIDELAAMGIEHFKISGRTLNPIQWFETIVYYLALPEHRNYVRQKLTFLYMNQGSRRSI